MRRTWITVFVELLPISVYIDIIYNPLSSLISCCFTSKWLCTETIGRKRFSGIFIVCVMFFRLAIKICYKVNIHINFFKCIRCVKILKLIFDCFTGIYFFFSKGSLTLWNLALNWTAEFCCSCSRRKLNICGLNLVSWAAKCCINMQGPKLMWRKVLCSSNEGVIVWQGSRSSLGNRGNYQSTRTECKGRSAEYK